MLFSTPLHISSQKSQTGLFSAVVAALLAATVLDLKQTSQDRSAFYLEQIYQLEVLANCNASRPSTPAKPPPFSAPKYAISVNSLWSLSPAMSLTSAMLATLQQQWARQYSGRFNLHGPSRTNERGCVNSLQTALTSCSFPSC